MGDLAGAALVLVERWSLSRDLFYDLIGQILFDFRSHSHLTFLREVEVMTLTLV
jgi:hypothetical protein